ncbi:MAG: type II toxin-antitoxin system mRNA interferase toxin, RelE/StbE family [Bifidobacterium sp.]|nr:type II toxin-antitoxin system mRNA interferase toxin, RelE/StbE family [Bifidobacterium sp.]
MCRRCRDRRLKGNLRRYRELHIVADWLLIYRIDGRGCSSP